MTPHGPPPPIPPRQPDYYAPGAGSTPASRFDTGAMVSHLIGWAVFAAVILALLLFVVPKFNEVLMDFKLDLPFPTKMLLSTSRFLTHGGVARVLLVLLVPIPLVHAAAVGVLFPRAGRGGRAMYRLLLTMALAALVLFVVLALFMPYVSLMQGVSGAGGGK